VVAEAAAAAGAAQAVTTDLVAVPLHAQTWELLLTRVGFVDVPPLPAGADDGRFAVTAVSPS
jgi:hypothetical protein